MEFVGEFYDTESSETVEKLCIHDITIEAILKSHNLKSNLKNDTLVEI